MSYPSHGQRNAPNVPAFRAKSRDRQGRVRRASVNREPPRELLEGIENLEQEFEAAPVPPPEDDDAIEDWFGRLCGINADAPAFFQSREPPAFTTAAPGTGEKQAVMAARVKAGHSTDHKYDSHLSPRREAYREQKRRAFFDLIDRGTA